MKKRTSRMYAIRHVATAAAAFIILILPAAIAMAQETRPAFGILASTTGERNTAGFIYDFSQEFSAKPQFTFYQVNTAVRRYGAALQFDWNTKVADAFSIYYGFEAEYHYDYSNYSFSGGSSQKSTWHYFTGSLVIGGCCMLNERFGFFADTGFSYSREYYDTRSTESGVSTMGKGARNLFCFRDASLGAVFYLF